MVNIADSYFETIEHANGKLAPFSDDCVRRENGTQTTRNPNADPADHDLVGPDLVRTGLMQVDVGITSGTRSRDYYRELPARSPEHRCDPETTPRRRRALEDRGERHPSPRSR